MRNTFAIRQCMKGFSFIFLLLLSSAIFANEIDELRTIQDVNTFLIEKVDRRFKDELPLSENWKNADTAKYARNNFYKVDIDNNGLTDLIIYGYDGLVAVLNTRSNKYDLHFIGDGMLFFEHETGLISIETSKPPTKIVIQRTVKPNARIDTLIFKFDCFIEYNAHPHDDFHFYVIKLTTSDVLASVRSLK